ncbi:hypothetical protein ACLB2K_049455 [Fragaria x ananassa]
MCIYICRTRFLCQNPKNPESTMQRQRLNKLSWKPIYGFAQFTQRRAMHDRNKKAMELIAKGWSALKEVDRVIDYCELNDRRLIPLLRAAKENFELALETDNANTHARYWLSRLHLKYHVPGACKAIGGALLVEAANMGDADAQYELACRLRVENEHVQLDQQAFHYLEKAVGQLHPGALLPSGCCVSDWRLSRKMLPLPYGVFIGHQRRVMLVQL